jgi:flagellar biosynthesis protein FlhF
MEVRSYYATTVEAAVELARQELGPEAMLVQSRRSTPDCAHLGRYEVVFAGESAPPRPRRPEPDLDGAGLGPVDLVEKLDFAAILRAAGVHPESALTEAGMVCSPGLGRSGSSADIVAFVGPTAAGKTSVLMKLALAHGLLASRAVRVLAFDSDRVGATNQLRHFAALLSIGFAAFETPDELCTAFTQHWSGLTLIDTPGYSRSEERELRGLAEAFRTHPEIETQLVLRADRKVADNLAAINRFAVFNPARLIVTALDETEDHADLPSLISRAAIPVSFLSTGQRIGDLEPSSPSRLEGFRKGKASASRAAA